MKIFWPEPIVCNSDVHQAVPQAPVGGIAAAASTCQIRKTKHTERAQKGRLYMIELVSVKSFWIVINDSI